MEIDLPDVVAEVKVAFKRYEKALVSNDVAALDAMFNEDTRTIRYGSAENLYGFCRDQSLSRRAFLGRFGPYFVQSRDHHVWARLRVTSTLFHRSSAKVGRQTQAWVRFPQGWRVVAAHVSEIATVP
jgi:Protein of unknown function (DUF3225)